MLALRKTISLLIESASVHRKISLTAVLAIDQKWRESKGLPSNPNEFGPLTNLPDYTFLDGRPTPMGVSCTECGNEIERQIELIRDFYTQSNQKKRLLRQQEIAAKIVELSSEIDYAKKRYANLKAEAAAERQRILKDKLKPKGHLLLKQK